MSAKRIRISRAKIVPPGPAIGPNTSRAIKKTDTTAKQRVNTDATLPCGGKNLVVNIFPCNVILILFMVLDKHPR